MQRLAITRVLLGELGGWKCYKLRPCGSLFLIAGRENCMTLGTAQELRDKWKKVGNPECDHVVLILQHGFDGFLTEPTIF